jgi:hypothetical protein
MWRTRSEMTKSRTAMRIAQRDAVEGSEAVNVAAPEAPAGLKRRAMLA